LHFKSYYFNSLLFVGRNTVSYTLFNTQDSNLCKLCRRWTE